MAVRSVVAVGEPVCGLRVQQFAAGTWHTLALSGELDLASKPAFSEAVERIDMTALEGIALDLSGVTFLDSTGIHCVVALHERCQEQDLALRIVPGPSRVQRVFSLCGLLDSLPFLGV